MRKLPLLSFNMWRSMWEHKKENPKVVWRNSNLRVYVRRVKRRERCASRSSHYLGKRKQRCICSAQKGSASILSWISRTNRGCGEWCGNMCRRHEERWCKQPSMRSIMKREGTQGEVVYSWERAEGGRGRGGIRGASPARWTKGQRGQFACLQEMFSLYYWILQCRWKSEK